MSIVGYLPSMYKVLGSILRATKTFHTMHGTSTFVLEFFLLKLNLYMSFQIYPQPSLPVSLDSPMYTWFCFQSLNLLGHKR